MQWHDVLPDGSRVHHHKHSATFQSAVQAARLEVILISQEASYSCRLYCTFTMWQTHVGHRFVQYGVAFLVIDVCCCTGAQSNNITVSICLRVHLVATKQKYTVLLVVMYCNPVEMYQCFVGTC